MFVENNLEGYIMWPAHLKTSLFFSALMEKKNDEEFSNFKEGGGGVKTP